MKTFKERVESLKEERSKLEQDICSRAEEICDLANTYYPSGGEYYHGYHFNEVTNIFTNSQNFVLSYDCYEGYEMHSYSKFISKELFDMTDKELIKLFEEMESKASTEFKDRCAQEKEKRYQQYLELKKEFEK